MGKLSSLNEASPSAELHLYLMFYGDLLVRGDFLQSVNSCVVF